MASNRWVAIDPDILTHPLVGAGQPVAPADPERGAYSRMEAWVWIICNASFADHTINNRGRKMTLRRGDLLGAYAFLAHTFNWSRKTAKLWIDQLIADNMLQRKALDGQVASGAVESDIAEGASFYGNQATILGVVNYWRFQFDGSERSENEGHQSGHQEGHQEGHQSAELSASKIADKYILQPQQGTPVGTPAGTPKGTHITKDTTTVGVTNNPLSEASSDEEGQPEPEKPKRDRKRRATTYSEAFEVFWTGYPDRTNNSKPKAFVEWEALTEPDQNAVVTSLPIFAAYCRKNTDYRVVHAERYLRDKRWESHLPADGAGRQPWWKDPAQIAQLTTDRWEAGIARYANGVWNVGALGPPPGHPECKVPTAIIDTMRLTDLYTDKGIRRQ